MELSISPHSFRVPPIISRHSKASSHENRLIQIIKPATKNIKSSNFPSKSSTNKLILPRVLDGERCRLTKSLLYVEHRRNAKRVCAQAHESADSNSKLAQLSRFGYACYQFTRPYTMYATIVTSISLFARVLTENPQLFRWSLLFKAFPGLIVMLLGNGFYCGVNQIFDADIDRVNKPYLPIPAGDLSLRQAWFLVIFYQLASQLILRLINADLITTSIYCLTLLLGFFYSAPPIRFKDSPIATSIISSVMGGVFLVNGVLYAARASLGIPFQWSPSTVFISTFVTSLFIVISNIKDLTDVEGDMMHNIQTLPAIYGPRKTTFFFTGILLLNYIGAIILAISIPQAFKPYIMVPFHAHMALWLLLEVRKLDKANYSKVYSAASHDQEESAKFYQFLWKLIGLEYLVYPFI